LANLPAPAGAAVAQWRGEGLSDARIRRQLLTAASWDGADGQIARLTGSPVPPPGSWQRALHELRRRDAVNREHEAAKAQRLSDALDVALTAAPDPGPTPGASATAQPAEQPVAPPPPTPKQWVLDLTVDPPNLPRYRVTKEFQPARPADRDAAIAAIAEEAGGRTDRKTISAWGRVWLRKVKQRDATAASLIALFESEAHANRRRPAHRPKPAK
jgi:hypothetical protein